jgi:corrinoid protein of di/trimethylamine methyltransferase
VSLFGNADELDRKVPAMEDYLAQIVQALIDGDADLARRMTQGALELGADPLRILNDGLMVGTDVVGAKFDAGELFLPDLMLTGLAMKSAMAVLEPVLRERVESGELERRNSGVVVIATIQTDIHDIGKNIVSSMLSAAGFQVHDLGVDVPLKTIIAEAKRVDADIIACSALLTTSLPFMRDLINLLHAMRERDRFFIIMGGAAVTQEFVDDIGADGYEKSAIRAVQLGQRLMAKKRRERGARNGL